MGGAAFTESPGAPLADYFFIAGVESSRVFDHSKAINGLAAPSSGFGPTIEESTITEEDDAVKTPVLSSVQNSPEPSKRNSKRFSWDKRKSISSISGLEPKSPASNRSSVTIKAPAPQENGTRISAMSGMSDDDFNAALKRFAADRDSILAEIQVTATERTSQPPKASKPRPRTQRLRLDEMQASQKSGIGSVRRRLSTMNSLTRQNTTRRAPQRFSIDPNENPLKRAYEPVLLDQYPSKEMNVEIKKRPPFPDYVPMFVFPKDVKIVAADERPKSTWHGFAMTTSDGSRLYGITMILWKALDTDAAAELERQLDTWRRQNMSASEREFANSLSDRLVEARKKLSELLAELPRADDRQTKEDEINELEERIQLMLHTLRPIRHAAASKIEGLTDGETGFWVPRAYGILGRDATMTGFWKDWLRAVSIPMLQGGVFRVPPSSPMLGTWQPLERYVVNLCAEALSPITSRTQVEMSIRELRMYARKDAINEIPGTRNTDLYALFRAVDIDVIVTLFEFALAEARIIFLSSHIAMLHLACQALVQLLYPLKWAGVFIPVLPERLLQALEAPCPYIIGVNGTSDEMELPDDAVWMHLDSGTIEASEPPPPLPRQQRRKLISILRLAAPHHLRYGVDMGPPEYAKEAYPDTSFSSEYPQTFDPTPSMPNLAHFANLSSGQFGSSTDKSGNRPPLFNAFLSARRNNSNGLDRPSTSAANGMSDAGVSPSSSVFPPSSLANSRNDSAASLQASLREKRSGLLDNVRRNSSIGLDRMGTRTRRPSAPMQANGTYHGSATSVSTLNTEYSSTSNYAPSVYAQSTLAASTIMPTNFVMTPRTNTETTQWMEGHCMKWDPRRSTGTCSICDEKGDEGIYKCSGCPVQAHGRCLQGVNLVCPAAFSQPQVLTAFLRCMASLLYTYRKHLQPTPRGEASKSGKLYTFNRESFLRSLPHDQAGYMVMLTDTQGLAEFIGERETTRPDDPNIRLFDEIILSKKNRGRASSVFGKAKVGFLEDRSEHLWRSAQAASPVSRDGMKGSLAKGGMPAKLERELLREPRVVQGMPRLPTKKLTRKQVPSLLSGLGRTQSEPPAL
ncbi:MAG: hypothetical protein Q9159_005054 [Coniocarpon cinnabarinum]